MNLHSPLDELSTHELAALFLYSNADRHKPAVESANAG